MSIKTKFCDEREHRLKSTKIGLRRDWERVLCSDEAPFECYGGKEHQRVRRGKYEAQHPHCVQQTVKFGGGKLMVWDCLSALGTGSLLRVKGFMDKNVYK